MDIFSASRAGTNAELKGLMEDFKNQVPALNGNRTAIRKLLNDKVNALTDKTFNKSYTADVIITYINAKEYICKEYPDTKSQVDSILEWLPRMKKYRDKLEKYVSKYRKQYGLKE